MKKERAFMKHTGEIVREIVEKDEEKLLEIAESIKVLCYGFKDGGSVEKYASPKYDKMSRSVRIWCGTKELIDLPLERIPFANFVKGHFVCVGCNKKEMAEATSLLLIGKQKAMDVMENEITVLKCVGEEEFGKHIK